MSEREERGWWSYFTMMLGLLLIPTWVTGLIPGPTSPQFFALVVPIAAGVLIGLPLLILSWRAAYLAGRKKR